MYSYRTFPSRSVLVRMLIPSVLTHALLLVWLVLSFTSPGPGVELYAVDLLPSASAIAPEPAAHRPPVDTTSGPAKSGVAVTSTTPRGGDAQLPAYVPPAAQAGRVLTAPESRQAGGESLDFSIVQGSAQRYAGGVTSSRGTSEQPVYDARARDEGARGVVGGTAAGTRGPAPPSPEPAAVAPRVDRSRPALPIRTSWNCAFPSGADVADINFARARVAVTVGVDGRAKSAVVLQDPGNGFGAAARRCALSERYSVARGRDGNPRVATTAPITVTFIR